MANNLADTLTAEEKARLDAALAQQKEKQRQAQVDDMIRNTVLDAEKKQPGKTGY